MKNITNAIIEKLNRMENFTLRTDGGGAILWDLNAPGLHLLLEIAEYVKFTGERGKAALRHHSSSGDFFIKTYDILNKAGLTREVAPDVWGYIRELNKYASTNRDLETKANTNIQLFRFIQELMETLQYREYQARTGSDFHFDQDIFRTLLVAADSFVVRGDDGYVHIMAGYPWFDQSWARDTFISMNGLLLVTGRFEYAKSVFSYYAKMQAKDGLLPNRIFSNGKIDYNTADGSLWYIEALNRYRAAARSKDADAFVKKMLPTVNRIVECYLQPSGNVYMDKDYLVVVPGQWTWMDAAPGGRPVTPRNGKPVEIQALFYNALTIASDLNTLSGNKRLAERYTEIKKEVAKSINERFFAFGREYPFDVLDGDAHCAAVRPNALMLLSLSCVDDLLPEERKRGVIEVVERELLTPYGLRSLSPNDARYIGTYDTFAPMAVKDLAYHQGSVWPYFMSFYVSAKLALAKDSAATAAEIREGMISSLIYTIKDKDTVPELFSGSEPYRPGGAVSQSWSVAAMLDIMDMLNRENQKKKGKAKQ